MIISRRGRFIKGDRSAAAKYVQGRSVDQDGRAWNSKRCDWTDRWGEGQQGAFQLVLLLGPFLLSLHLKHSSQNDPAKQVTPCQSSAQKPLVAPSPDWKLQRSDLKSHIPTNPILSSLSASHWASFWPLCSSLIGQVRSHPRASALASPSFWNRLPSAIPRVHELRSLIRLSSSLWNISTRRREDFLSLAHWCIPST